MHQAAAVRRHPVVGSALLLLALVVPLVPTAADARPPERALVVEVLSSAPDQVTDGDALVRVAVPRQVPASKVRVLAGGRDVTGAFERSADRRSLVGVVTGLPLGPTEIVAKANGSGSGRPEPGRVTVVNHPRSGPVFSGPHQQPFVCATARATFDGRRLLGQPTVDNQDHIGIPVAVEGRRRELPRGRPRLPDQ